MQLHACEWAEAPAATYCISRPAARAARALIALRARRSRRKRGQSRTTKGRRVSTYSTYLHTYVHPAHRPDAVAVSFLVFFLFLSSFSQIIPSDRNPRGSGNLLFFQDPVGRGDNIVFSLSCPPSSSSHSRRLPRRGGEEGEKAGCGLTWLAAGTPSSTHPACRPSHHSKSPYPYP